MEAVSLGVRPQPSGLLLGLAAAACTLVGIVAWIFLALELFFAAPWSSQWLLSGIALPGATLGSLATHSTKRWWPFVVGLAITLIPVVLYIVLPEPPPVQFD